MPYFCETKTTRLVFGDRFRGFLLIRWGGESAFDRAYMGYWLREMGYEGRRKLDATFEGTSESKESYVKKANMWWDVPFEMILQGEVALKEEPKGRMGPERPLGTWIEEGTKFYRWRIKFLENGTEGPAS